MAVLALTFPVFADIAEKEYLDTSKWDVGDYVQEGLIVHYDGIRNVGADAAHSDTTTVWSNLAPDHTEDWPAYWASHKQSGTTYPRTKNDDSQGSWSSNGFVFNGQVAWMKWNEGKTFSVPSTYSMQFVLTANTADQTGDNTVGYLFAPHSDYGWTKGSVHIRKTAIENVTEANAIYPVDADRLGSTSVRPYLVDASPRYATIIADDLAVRTFSGTTPPASGTSGYAAVTGTSPARTMNWFALGTIGTNDKKSVGALAGFIGTLHDFRLYSSALTEEQLEQNRIVDDARFFGVRHPVTVTNAVVASTYSFLDGAEPAGFYTVDGSHEFTAPSGDVTATNGITYRCIGHTLETWNDATQTWGDPVQNDGSLAVAVSSSDLKRITWLWKPVHGIRTAADYSLADYSQAGLILHYDGIHNDGADAVHSTTAKKWKNIAVGWEDQDMYWVSYRKRDNQDDENVLQADRWVHTRGSWNKTSGFDFDGYECFMKWNEGRKFVLPPAYTWQFAMEPEWPTETSNNGAIAYLFMPHSDWSWERGSIAMRTTANGTTTAPNAIYSVDTDRFGGTTVRPQFSNPAPRTATVLADSNALRAFGGTEIPTAAPGCRQGSLAIPRTNNWFAIGGQYQPETGDNTVKYFQGFHGTLHAVRFYDRPLTQEEVERNINTDSARFFGALATTNVVVEIGNTDGQITATPAVGAYKVEGSYNFTATGAVTGYKLEAWNDATGDWDAPTYCEETTFSYDTDYMPSKLRLTWRKSLPFVLVVR